MSIALDVTATSAHMYVGTNNFLWCPVREKINQKDPNPTPKVLRLTLILGRASNLDLALYLYLNLSLWVHP